MRLFSLYQFLPIYHRQYRTAYLDSIYQFSEIRFTGFQSYDQEFGWTFLGFANMQLFCVERLILSYFLGSTSSGLFSLRCSIPDSDYHKSC